MYDTVKGMRIFDLTKLTPAAYTTKLMYAYIDKTILDRTDRGDYS